ncbi:cache domain-containing protein [Colwellia sp. 4_MG-2023]|uniref:cache domain-containing protein n=1 Tax=unclassified Colwellia TaxID=196834 RepID=UPI001C08EC77|nr:MULTISPECIES: cache domain-containing protein [unclassified Colwellia]MBU2925909.1 cache domain-containing protein [Colwellia sp. C2M11]MDO6488519.1 cache domain-containing protein [Colwellia sp. 6_MG-2023]MDO6507394.1 cache domain-containing protein [Colwellia sp. 5_MG-2023]MDO6556186.1 cache domain-containing protein [Colwellia sp. 4_MG-2023]MDO6652693.1 cache domain-containing protein [Colwellia sp. 3_MG-2023]
MTLPLRLLYIAIFQVILTSIITYYLVSNEYRELSVKTVKELEIFLIKQKEQELKNYTSIALTSVEHMYPIDKNNDDKVKGVVADIVENMLYNGDDGYFFIYDTNGNSVVHPKQPNRVGQSWWDLRDDNGEMIIQVLIKNAQKGGDFYRYNWSKPSEGQPSEKMGYSTMIERWDWMIGTGVYLDDVYKQLNETKNEISRHINRTKKIILVVALSSIFFIFLFGIAVNLSHKKRAEEKINELGQRVIDVQEEENRHISRELHDGIIQILVSIKYSLEATRLTLLKNKQEKPEPLTHAEKNLAFAIQEVRRISHHMHPQVLDELGLSVAIESIAQDFSKRTGVAIQVFKPTLRKLLPDFINTTLFRVVQETLTNIQKHAEAKSVIISLSIQDDWLILTIKDDGKGFDIENNNTSYEGIGLRNLAERVQYHKGEFDIKSSKKGTLITVKIPMASFVNHFNAATIRTKDDDR